MASEASNGGDSCPKAKWKVYCKIPVVNKKLDELIHCSGEFRTIQAARKASAALLAAGAVVVYVERIAKAAGDRGGETDGESAPGNPGIGFCAGVVGAR